MDNKQTYYFITVFEKMGIGDLGYPENGDTWCCGFYTNKQTAYDALHNNWADMNETIYDYAVIEEYHEGISHYTGVRQFFKFDYDKKGYFEIDEPNGYEHFISFSIG